ATRAWRLLLLRYREDVVVGLKKASAAFIGRLNSRNFGKPEPTRTSAHPANGERTTPLFTEIAEPPETIPSLGCGRAASACFGEQRPFVGGVLFGNSVRSLRAANSGRGIHAILRPRFSRPVYRLRSGR